MDVGGRPMVLSGPIRTSSIIQPWIFYPQHFHSVLTAFVDLTAAGRHLRPCRCSCR
jgi:hypothetical protein